METATNSAPTGCFKCGRPGHWSRDCPSSAGPGSGDLPSSSSSAFSRNPNFQRPAAAAATTSASAASKAPKKRATRPKLTPELLLSNDGLGYVLRYFPRSFKYRGRGREVSDLGNLIQLYSEWHSHLLPYYSFEQFVHKVEQVAATKRVKTCIKELRERVASGGDPAKLYENPADHTSPIDDDQDQPSHDPANIPSKNANPDSFQEVFLNEIYDDAMDETHHRTQREAESAADIPDAPGYGKEPSNDETNETMSSRSIELTEEQRARVEANRLKALERAQGITEEQRARMEANRQKALERAKARLKTMQSV